MCCMCAARLVLSVGSLYVLCLFVAWLSAVVPPLVDHALAPGEQSLSLDRSWSWAPFVNAKIFHVEERIHNHSALPIQCSDVLLFHVPNVSVAHTCLSWCRESLGQGSAFAYAFSPEHHLAMSKIHLSHFHILKACWKVEAASWALKWMPHVWQMYFYSFAYGSISAFTLLFHLLYLKRQREIGYNEFLQPETSESSGENSSEKSEERSGAPKASWSLYFGVLGTLVGPGSDLLSMMTFMRNGQLYLALYVILGLLCSLVWSGDPFQLKGARAAAESLQNGSASRELLQHKGNELSETLVSTTVQIYALLSLDVHTVQPYTALNLMGGATFSMLISLPSQWAAVWILAAPMDVENAEVQQVKAMKLWRKLFFWVIPLALACFFLVCGGSESRAKLDKTTEIMERGMQNMRPWRWILAMLVSYLILCACCAFLCFLPLCIMNLQPIDELLFGRHYGLLTANV